MQEVKTTPKQWDIKGNSRFSGLKNPLRNFVEKQIPPRVAKAKQIPTRPHESINLSIGDPARYNDFKTNPKLLEQVAQGVGKIDGYTDFRGHPAAREALAKFYTTPANKVSADDVFIVSGGSLSLWLCIALLANPGDNFLFGEASFPLATTMAKAFGIQVRFYKRLPDKDWEIDMTSLESLVDEKTRFMMVIDPSNPLGTVWPEAHKRQIVAFCEKHHLPLVVDEIYETMTFKPSPPLFSQIRGTVPVFKCAGLTKRWLVPGWRIGWLILYGGAELDQVRKGLRNLMDVILMANTIPQAQLPQILSEQSNLAYLQTKMQLLGKNQDSLSKGLASESEYCQVSNSSGALYSVIRVQSEKLGFKNTIDFTLEFFTQENVLLFPGEFFISGGFVRLVICCSNEHIEEFVIRFKRFCRARLQTKKL